MSHVTFFDKKSRNFFKPKMHKQIQKCPNWSKNSKTDPKTPKTMQKWPNWSNNKFKKSGRLGGRVVEEVLAADWTSL